MNENEKAETSNVENTQLSGTTENTAPVTDTVATPATEVNDAPVSEEATAKSEAAPTGEGAEA